ncbi:MAG TPA: glycosyltransferase family 9 protein [Saprospiraceae bacterium]|nr:glycosyltransferase family 9 protein [Saprospiraceae bacterium]
MPGVFLIMASVLFIQTAFLGDVVLATSLVEKWKSVFPHDLVDVLVRRGNESVFADNPNIRHTLIWDKKRHKYRELLQTAVRIRRNHYDKVFNLQRFFSTGFLTVFSGAGQTIGFQKNPLSFLFDRAIPHRIEGPDTLHEIERNQQLIAPFTGDEEPMKPKIYPTSAHRQNAAAKIRKPYIVAAPASVWFTKQFPKEKWVSFLSQIPQSYSVALIGSPGDRELCAAIETEVRSMRSEIALVNLCGELNIQESAALMQSADMNYVNDSAPLHIASAVNAPVAAIFCSTIPQFGFGPLSDVRHVIECPSGLYCRPCGLHGKKACPEKHFRCALEIEDQQLLAVLPHS